MADAYLFSRPPTFGISSQPSRLTSFETQYVPFKSRVVALGSEPMYAKPNRFSRKSSQFGSGRCEFSSMLNETRISIGRGELLDSPQALGFEAEAEVGPVECYNRGCRPVYDDTCTLPSYWAAQAYTIEGLPSSTKEERGSPELNLSCYLEKLLNGFWTDKGRAEQYYESAVRVEPRNSRLLAEYAQFVWNILANATKAEQLFEKALQEAPTDADILASYACFLWQTEV